MYELQTAASAALEVARGQASQTERDLDRERQQRNSLEGELRQARSQLAKVSKRTGPGC